MGKDKSNRKIITINLVGYPEDTPTVGSRRLEIDYAGETLGGLIHLIEERYGRIITGCPNIRVLYNGKMIGLDDLHLKLSNSDTLTFCYPLVVAGG